MCLTPRKIYTNSHYLLKNGMEQYALEVPCMDCIECITAISNEWKLRTYYEYINCVKNNGYIIWDCLTYSEKNVPKLSKLEKHVPDKYDFICLCRKDIRDFLTRLNSNLKYLGYDIDNKIKHLICGEYGQDPFKTERGHYHIAIYVYNSCVPANILSQEIKKAWQKGRTCGITDNPVYFKNKGVVKGRASAIKVANYIGKYCLKNQNYDRVAKKRVENLVEFYHNIECRETEDNIFRKPEWRKRRDDILRNVKTFHVQSKHFGEYAMLTDRNQKLIEDGFIGMPDNKRIWVQCKTPMYFFRKKYYDIVKDENKQRHWQINNDGINFKMKHFEKSIDQYKNSLENLEIYAQSPELLNDINDYFKKTKSTRNATDTWMYINDLLYTYRNKRDWRQFIIYKTYYKGRINTGQWWDTKDIIMTPMYKKASLYTKTIDKKGKPIEIYNNAECYYNYNTISDKDHFGHRFITTENCGNKWIGYRKKCSKYEKLPRKFELQHCINENYLPEWNDFDKLDEIIKTINFYKQFKLMQTWIHRKELKEKAKQQKLINI